jgi:hypothetical protein
MKRALFNLTFLALSGVAASDQPHGGSWKDVKVIEVTVYTAGGTSGKGYVVVTFTANGTGPSCANGYPRSVAIDSSTPGGAFAAGIVQYAFLIGAPLTVTGTGACSVIPNTETLDSIQEQSLRRD